MCVIVKLKSLVVSSYVSTHVTIHVYLMMVSVSGGRFPTLHWNTSAVSSDSSSRKALWPASTASWYVCSACNNKLISWCALDNNAKLSVLNWTLNHLLLPVVTGESRTLLAHASPWQDQILLFDIRFCWKAPASKVCGLLTENPGSAPGCSLLQYAI